MAEHAPRYLRVIPLATRVVEVLNTEPDREVREAAWRTAGLALDVQKAGREKGKSNG